MNLAETICGRIVSDEQVLSFIESSKKSSSSTIVFCQLDAEGYIHEYPTKIPCSKVVIIFHPYSRQTLILYEYESNSVVEVIRAILSCLSNRFSVREFRAAAYNLLKEEMAV